jgi:hypothetical protein
MVIVESRFTDAGFIFMRVLDAVLRDVRCASSHEHSEHDSWLWLIGYRVFILSFGFLFERFYRPFRWSQPCRCWALYYTTYSRLLIILYYYDCFVYSVLPYFIHLVFRTHVLSCVRDRIVILNMFYFILGVTIWLLKITTLNSKNQRNVTWLIFE